MKPDLSEARARIIAELEAVEASVLQGSASAETVELDQSSMGRVSRIDALQQQALAKGLQERLDQRRRKLAAALSRIDAGSYGLCCACQAEVETERLRADPAVVFCSECAEERERR